MSARILTGTASWTDPTLLACGRFYPPEARDAASRLRFYASRFGLVEADASFYALADPAVSHTWTQRTPPGFVFNMKAFRLFTGHATPAAALPRDMRRDLGLDDAPDSAVLYDNQVPPEWLAEIWNRQLMALEPLRQADRLGALHLQFAPWVRRDARGMARVRAAIRHAREVPTTVEFRHRSWFDGAHATRETLAFERDLGVVHTVVDAPQGFDNTVPAVWETTSDALALVRLHGRNAASWNTRAGASSSRFQYEYTPEEIADLARRIAALAERSGQTHVVLNTNYQDQGVTNAANLNRALGLV
ncbi:hypothetical protein CEG14_18875 [Bordetella genomosp. 1]|uniref:DUF72 domain-containing protein n=1 Tax=Bordetella genomosp. 1 TaxID=1395607 RepID=A0A261S744_9BORD|nr:DUF72 domain-containing protein [Bordetella genomosp. 1]OZI32941.1 hypothetical protein CEG14_18875 [Bordetella genomosp. 1]